MKQPLSTISNIVYLIVGGAVFSFSTLPLQQYVGAAIFLLGIASAGYHWTGAYGWQKADEIGMLAVFSGLIFWQAYPYDHHIYLVVLSIGFGVLLGFTHQRWNNDTVGLLALIAVCLHSVHSSIVWAVVVAALFIGALFVSGRFGDRENDDFNHAIWHLLTGIGILILAL